jgi:exodeoxyribonuclease VII small subunit
VDQEQLLPIYGEVPGEAGRRGRAGGADSAKPNLEELLAQLEASISQLAGGTAPLEELVATHQRALRLLAEAQGQLEELKGRAEQTARLLSE